MHKNFSMKKQELSIVLAVDNYLTKNEKLKFYNQCKKTTRHKIDVGNLGMLIFFQFLSNEKLQNGLIEKCESFNRFK